MNRILNYILNSLPYVFVFISSLYIPSDPDLGWHIKYGEYFFKHHQILRDNIFSSSMTNYHWANGSWGTDILTYLLFNWYGYFALTIVSALIVTFTFFFFSKSARLTLYEKLTFFPLLIFLEIGTNSNSFRGQQISMLFLSVLIYILSRYKMGSKVIWIIPILILIWSNMQIESFLGLAVLLLWFAFDLLGDKIFQKKIMKYKLFTYIGVFILSFATTYINPFGWHIHLVAIAHIGDQLLFKVSEYVPFSIFSVQWWSQIGMVFLMFIVSIILLKERLVRKYFPLWSILIIFIILTFFVRRYSWPAYYMVLPFLYLLWQRCTASVKNFRFHLSFGIFIAAFFVMLHTKLPLNQYLQVNTQEICRVYTDPCSSKGAQYVMKYKLTKNLLTFYDWGGWLILNYPAIKPSIDGRMHLWRDAQNWSPMEEYDDYMNLRKDINKSSYTTIFMPNDRTIPLYWKLSELMTKKQWKLAYIDEYAVIYTKIN